MSRFTSRSLLATLCLAAFCGVGCAAKPDSNLQALAFSGEYGRAREHIAKNISPQQKDANDRAFFLNRMKFALAAMSDGYCTDDPIFEQVYDTLSKQGLNKGKEATAVVFNEDLKTWKGEPFEQAIMLAYLSMLHASQGSWDNARAAAGSAQFRLKDFGSAENGKRKTNEDLVRGAATAKDEEAFYNSYKARDTDFALGILLDAIANQQLGRQDEAASKFKDVAKIRPDLEELVSQLAKGDYKDVLVVSWGQGPQKIGTGPDQAVASWAPIQRGSNAPLLVNVAGRMQQSYPVVCDVNAMSQDHMWNNLQDVRKAKSLVGSVMVGTGAGVLAYGAHKNDSNTMIAGAAIALIGAGLKAGAHADTRYCDIMPQRFYVVPIKDGDGKSIDVQIANRPVSRMTLAPLPPRDELDQTARLRYVNLVASTSVLPSWAASGEVLYNNDEIPVSVERPWPYIMGGDCVRKPTQAAMDAYHAAGYLGDMIVTDLQELYRQEGIVFDGPEQLRTRHILEGGRSLDTPLAGTAGFTRLFGQRHPPYVPTSQAVRTLALQLQSQGATPIAGR